MRLGNPVTERRVQVGAVVVGIVGLLMVWHLVNILWAEGWSMDLIHAVAILSATVVTLAASVTVVAVVIHYRRILERKNSQLQWLAAIGETLAEISHYQKNLLNGLRGGLYITDGAMEKGDKTKLRTGWQMLNNSVQRIEKLTLDMLYYAKERVPVREPTNLSEVLREIIDLMEESAASRGVRFHAEFDEGMGPQLLDRTAIFRAVLNLVSNAIDACAESESGELVTLRTRAVLDEVVITVADNGIGMSDEVRTKSFVGFYSTKGGQGTGLGLPLVKKIVAEHGGTLIVESKLGEGSAFHLHFPKAPEAGGNDKARPAGSF
jgi:signal transduction histidine kinase